MKKSFIEFTDLMYDSFGGYDISMRKIEKEVGREGDSFFVLKIPEVGDFNINAETLYEKYTEAADDFVFIENLVNIINTAKGKINEIKGLNGYVADKNIIVMALVETKEWQKFFDKIPHRQLDNTNLTITYRLITEIGDGYTESALVTNELANNLGLKEDALYVTAHNYSYSLFPITIEPIPLTCMDFMDDDNEANFFFITNCSGCGANIMASNSLMSTIAEKLNSSFYILPISTAELIIIRSEDVDDEDILFQLVLNGNKDVENPLSNTLYFFNKDTEELVVSRTE